MKVKEDIVYTHTYKVKANREGEKKKKEDKQPRKKREE